MDLEKMIVVKKSTKWWMTVVASASLAVGAVGGYGIGALTQRSPQQSSVQATMPQQKNQEGKIRYEYSRGKREKTLRCPTGIFT